MACCVLSEMAYGFVTTLFSDVVTELASYQAPIGYSSHEPDGIICQLKTVIGEAKYIIDAKMRLKSRFPEPTEQEMSLLAELHSSIEEIEKEVLAPIEQLGINKRSPKEVEKTYKRLAKRVACPILRKLKANYGLSQEKVRKAGSLWQDSIQKAEMKITQMACVSLDMERYSLMARMIQAVLDAEALYKFNERLQNAFRIALKNAGAEPDETPIDDTGDGALVFLPNVDLAVMFSIEVLKATFADNLSSPDPQWHKHLRIGIDVGDVALSVQQSGNKVTSFSTGGVPIINAVRIQTGCPRGLIAISDQGWGHLKPKLQKLFGDSKWLPTKEKKGKTKEKLLKLRVRYTRSGAGLDYK